MNAPDWKKLAPQEPAPLGAYVARPDSVAVRVKRRLEQGTSPIAIAGPTGGGKSTELERLRNAMQGDRLIAACLQDHYAPVAQSPLVERDLLWSAAVFLLFNAGSEEVELGNAFKRRWQLTGFLPDMPRNIPIKERPADAIRELIAELATRGDHRRPVILLDGLERREDVEIRRTLGLFRPLLASLDLVVVLPSRWTGNDEFSAALDGYRVEALRPLPVRSEHGTGWREGRTFLTQIVCKRLGVGAPPNAAAAEILDRAAEASGGIPRVFLQLVQDAAFYGAVAGREWPDADDLRQAMRDQVSSLRRLLRPGDLAALQAARGTDGLEVDIERRVRFLGHGLLLEYGDAEDTHVYPAPLLEGLLALRSAA